MNKKNGFFFLEIAISLFVLLFLSGALIQFFVSNITLYKKMKLRQQALQMAIQKIEECSSEKDSFFNVQENNYKILIDGQGISSIKALWKEIIIRWEPEQELSLFALSSII